MQQENDVNCLMNQYLSKIHSLLETYAPLQKVNEKRNFSPNHGLYKACKIFLKTKMIYAQNF